MFTGCGTSRDVALCAWTILSDKPLLAPDVSLDPRFARHPLVVGPPFIRAYCGFPLMPTPGLAIGTLCVLNDKPAQLDAEQLAQLGSLAELTTDLLRQRARNETVAVISHEIRSSLYGVIGLANMLCDAVGLPAEAAGHAKVLGQAGGHLLQLTTDALEFTRIEAGRLTLEQIEFEPAAEITAVLAMLRAQAEAGGVRLAFELAPGVPSRVVGDPGRLRQVLLNLCGNAIKFAAGGSVSVALSAMPGPRLRFEVRDTGIGMAPEALAKLFEVFGQAEASTARRYGGSGLGLVICRRLVELMGGSILVDSVPGRGSTFRFDIEVAAASAARAPELVGRVAEAAAPRNILLAEDTEVIRLVTTNMLRRLGHEVELAADGREAVAALVGGRFDLVLMDVNMPEMDGIAATRSIRARPGAGPRVPILGLTADDSDQAVTACLAAGMDGVLRKPVTAPKLAAALEQHCPAA
jgi:signal transduction histidine kinase/CheY-like chemotaxis protein